MDEKLSVGSQTSILKGLECKAARLKASRISTKEKKKALMGEKKYFLNTLPEKKDILSTSFKIQLEKLLYYKNELYVLYNVVERQRPRGSQPLRN